MKLILLGDTHLGASKSSDILHDYMEKFYDFMFAYIADHPEIKAMVQVGDLYDERKQVYFNTLHRSRKYFTDRLYDSGLNRVVVFAGNHDVLFKNTNRISSVNLLHGEDDNFDVIDMGPKTLSFDGVGIDFYPWINAENLDESVKYARESKSKYAMGHFEFKGFPMHPGSIAETGMSHTLFKRYDCVFSGHYHTISQEDNVQYIGTPYELNWSDCEDPKGFWIFDTETGEKEFVRNPYTLFEKITYTEGMTFDFTQVKNKYLKIIVLGNPDTKKFQKFLDNISINKPHGWRVIDKNDHKEAVENAVDATNLVTTHQMISNVIDNMEVDLDKSQLKTYVLEFYQEAMALNNEL